MVPWTWEGGVGGEGEGECHTTALPFTLKSTLRQKKKNYGNSNISPMQKYNLLQKKSSKKKPKSFKIL
jgi:hypothetical protein